MNPVLKTILIIHIIHKITLNITINVTNDSEFDFVLKKYDLVIAVNNNKVSKIKNSNVNEKLKGNGSTSQLNFDVSFNPREFGLADILSQVITTLGKTMLSVTGSLVVQKGVLTIELPLELTYKIEDFI